MPLEYDRALVVHQHACTTDMLDQRHKCRFFRGCYVGRNDSPSPYDDDGKSTYLEHCFETGLFIKCGSSDRYSLVEIVTKNGVRTETEYCKWNPDGYWDRQEPQNIYKTYFKPNSHRNALPSVLRYWKKKEKKEKKKKHQKHKKRTRIWHKHPYNRVSFSKIFCMAEWVTGIQKIFGLRTHIIFWE